MKECEHLHFDIIDKEDFAARCTNCGIIFNDKELGEHIDRIAGGAK